MINIEKIYDPKSEFKKLFMCMRYYTNQQKQQSVNKQSLEFYLTNVIDDYIAHWKQIQMSTNTLHKLHLFAIAFRHNVVNNGIH